MYSIRAKITTIALVFLAFLGAAFVLYSMVTTMNYKRLRLEDIEKTVAFETEKVNKIIAAFERGAVSVSADGLLYYKTQSIDIGQISVLEYLRGFPTAVGSGFWFEPYAYNKNAQRAGVYAFFNRTMGEVSLDEFVIDDYDYHSLDWYRDIIDEIKEPYQVVWTKPYMDDTVYRYMTTAGAGIFNEYGNLIGITTIDWGIEEIIEELSAIRPTKNSFILLCVPERDFIITNTLTNSGAGDSLQSIPWDINAASFTLGSVTYFRFGRLMDNGWLLSVQIPEKEIFAEIEKPNNRFSVIIAFSSLVMLCLVYVLISKLINAPIQQLISEVAQLAVGNLDNHIEVTSKDELGMLALTFNKMTLDLKESIEAYTHERSEKERIGTELSIATRIQAQLLPSIFPPFPDRSEFDIFASMLPAKEVGGDFYDFFFLDRNNLAVVIADVSGKGVPAALFMVIAKILIKNSACSGKSPAGVFESVNNTLCENNDAGMFVTAFMGYLDLSSGNFVYVNAGHNPPLVKRKAGDYEFIKSKPCLVLAGMEDTLYSEDEIILEPGDSVYLYTDGVTEAMNGNREFFSELRLLEVLNKYRDNPPDKLLPAIKREIDIFAGAAEQADDITMLALRVNNSDEPAELEML